ncbi:hypothetical protein GCM10009037_20670 [Halarchaeum grantii]|uniref:histidine kinase n=1 Tax=Halarchaeum grantii TaxID=1193105 RepID=A0A830F3Z1_9EURY|nr:PAS domain-containing sensor histidine kinase [Halarchaeum grantii]GGL37036.1 hypothetical protein GCM10009037_20670 [Halarchaeum grantii]
MSTPRWRPDAGVALALLGSLLFAATIALTLHSGTDPVSALHAAYVGTAALFVAAGGALTVRREWTPSEQRRVLSWTLLGAGFLAALTVLSLLGRLTTGPVTNPRFFVLQFTVFGCLGGTVVGGYHALMHREMARAASHRERFETVVQNVPLPVVVVEGDDTVSLWNAAAEETFGYTPEEVLGEPVPMVPPARESEREEFLARLEAGRRVEGARTQRRHRDGTLLDVELWASPMTHPDGEGAAVFVLRDLTRTLILEQEHAVLERVLRHNLRNELTVIQGYAREVDADDDAEVRALDAIRDAADRLHSLSEHVDRLRHLDDTVASRDVTAITTEVVEEARTRHPEASITVDVPETAWAQTVPAIRDAITEAVENAVVHADDAEPTVAVDITCDADSDSVRVSVADTGPGIPDAEWDPIVAGDEAPLRHGSGLGLWVMQWACARSGGELSKSERDPRGTVVTLTLPRTMGAATSLSGDRAAAIAARFSR